MPIMSPTLAEATAERDGGVAVYQRHRPERTLLYRIVVVLVVLYVPWCVVHGVMLKKRLADKGPS